MNDWPKAVAVAAVWIATGFALGHGVFKMNFSGGPSAFYLLLILPIILVGGALLATVVIWRHQKLTDRTPENQ